uniref:Uncharacterized protein n=1 Tax=uncultured marine virus TaxID=186617 RepID=A0A0F7L5C6_9VIRU|nr:hypothetical protein [uncultured marine virus]
MPTLRQETASSRSAKEKRGRSSDSLKKRAVFLTTSALKTAAQLFTPNSSLQRSAL